MTRSRRRPGAGAPIAAHLLALVTLAAGCGRGPDADAYGTFEATEVVVSAETSGQIKEFVPREGVPLAPGVTAAVIDTTQLALERRQIEAQRGAAESRRVEVGEQLEVLTVQAEIARRAYERTRRLHDARAATSQQLDQAEGEYRTLVARIEAVRAQERSVGMETVSSDARVAQIDERIARSVVRNPTGGTVLTVYARAGEVVQPGQPLYRIARLDTLDLRAYVTGDQLARVRLGMPAEVRVEGGDGELLTLPGTVSWISAEAEFTPTPIQTRDERADLVYAVRLRVPNTGGRLKIGMPADVTFGAQGERGDSSGAGEGSEPAAAGGAGG